ncbi:MAG: ABC transporter substrate-binding protein [Treponema sp.]|nr:ABC transporter substrate-binding protein [Treponema sp.]
MKKVQKLLLLFFSLTLLASCKKTNESTYKKDRAKASSSNLILGFSQIGAESAWRKRNTESIQQAAAKANIQIVFNDAQQKQANQIKAIRSFIVYRVDVIAFVPIIETGWDNVLKDARDAKIPVFVVDRKIKVKDESLYAGYIGEDGFQEGCKAAQFLLDKYKDSKKHVINILELRGTENSSPATDRSLGFTSTIATDSRFSIIYSESGDFLRSRGKEIVSNIITENQGLNVKGSPIDIIFSHNDAMTLGVLDTLASHNIKSGDELTIVSVDGEEKAINALKAGRINCVVECNPNIGPQLMYLVKTIANRNTIPRETYIEETVFTENDDLSSLAPRGY